MYFENFLFSPLKFKRNEFGRGLFSGANSLEAEIIKADKTFEGKNDADFL